MRGEIPPLPGTPDETDGPTERGRGPAGGGRGRASAVAAGRRKSNGRDFPRHRRSSRKRFRGNRRRAGKISAAARTTTRAGGSGREKSRSRCGLVLSSSGASRPDPAARHTVKAFFPANRQFFNGVSGVRDRNHPGTANRRISSGSGPARSGRVGLCLLPGPISFQGSCAKSYMADLGSNRSTLKTQSSRHRSTRPRRSWKRPNPSSEKERKPRLALARTELPGSGASIESPLR